MRLAILLVVVVGCSSDEPVMKTVQSAGRVCLHGKTTAEGQLYAADASVTIIYETPGCLSYDCDRERSASCQTEVIDGGLNIHSFASWTDYGHINGICTDDCGTIAAKCETGPLPASTYPVMFGTASIAYLTVPSTLAEPLCIEAE